MNGRKIAPWLLLLAASGLAIVELNRAQKAGTKADRLTEFCDYARADFCRVRNELAAGHYTAPPTPFVFDACAPGVWNDWKLTHEGKYEDALLSQINAAIAAIPNEKPSPDWPECLKGH